MISRKIEIFYFFAGIPELPDEIEDVEAEEDDAQDFVPYDPNSLDQNDFDLCMISFREYQKSNNLGLDIATDRIYKTPIFDNAGEIFNHQAGPQPFFMKYRFGRRKKLPLKIRQNARELQEEDQMYEEMFFETKGTKMTPIATQFSVKTLKTYLDDLDQFLVDDRDRNSGNTDSQGSSGKTDSIFNDLAFLKSLISSRHYLPIEILQEYLQVMERREETKQKLGFLINLLLEILDDQLYYHPPNSGEKKDYYKKFFGSNVVQFFNTRCSKYLVGDKTKALQFGLLHFFVKVLEMEFTYW